MNASLADRTASSGRGAGSAPGATRTATRSAAIRDAGLEVRDVERFDEPGALLAKPHVARVGGEALIASTA